MPGPVSFPSRFLCSKSSGSSLPPCQKHCTRQKARLPPPRPSQGAQIQMYVFSGTAPQFSAGLCRTMLVGGMKSHQLIIAISHLSVTRKQLSDKLLRLRVWNVPAEAKHRPSGKKLCSLAPHEGLLLQASFHYSLIKYFLTSKTNNEHSQNLTACGHGWPAFANPASAGGLD